MKQYVRLELLSFSSPVDIISQVFEVRTIFEPPAAELAAIRRTDRDIALLGNELESLQNIISVRESEREPLGSKHNAILHNLIIAVPIILYCNEYMRGFPNYRRIPLQS